MNQQTNRYLWYLYDFANSIALVGVMYYFGPWIVGLGYSQWLVSVPISVATVVVLLVMPAVARRVDVAGSHKKTLVVLSAVSGISLATLALVPTAVLGQYGIFLTYFAFYFCFQSAYIFYTALLSEVRGELSAECASGVGQAWGQGGNLAGVLLSFVTIGLVFAGLVAERSVFFVGALVFLVCLIPIARWMCVGGKRADAVEAVGEVSVGTFKKIFRNKPILRFLISYLLYADAMMTVSFFVTLYFSRALMFDAGQIKVSSVILLVGTIFGGIVCSKFVGRCSTVPMLRVALVLWPLSIGLLAVTSAVPVVFATTFFAGILLSVIFSLSRAYYSGLIPYEQRAEYFSAYVVFERAGAIVGPLLWSVIVAFAMPLGEPVAYRIALGSVALITAGAFFMFPRTK